MNLNISKKLANLALAGLFALTISSFVSGDLKAQCTACVNAVTLPTGNVGFASINMNDDPAADPASNGNGFFTLNLTGVAPGTSLDNAPYTAWCGAWYSANLQQNGTPGNPVYSTYSSSLPSGNLPIVSGNNFNMVNYILNNKQGYVQDVQDAIWLIITGHTDSLAPPSTTAIAMAAAAQAHPTYVPSAFGTMAVFYAIGPNTLASNSVTASNQLQSLLFEIPVPLANNNTPTLACASSSGQAGTAYSSSIVAAGGIAPYAYSFTGSLPNGLFLNPTTGALTGVPSTSGTFNYTAQAIDSSGQSAGTVTASCSITISQPVQPLALVCPATLTGQVGVAYSAALVASGGTGHYTYSLASGSYLPSGLTLNASSGFIAGVPLTAGSVNFTGTVTDTGDTASTPVSATCGISIAGAPTANCVSITAMQGRAITPVTLTGSYGAGGPYTFSAVGLPTGLVLSAAGEISGTPSVSGNFTYTVTVTDKAGHTGTFECSVTVAPPPPPLGLSCSANTGQVGVAYSSYLLATGGTGHYTFSIATGSLPAGLTLNTSTGLISGTPTSSTPASFTAQVVDNTDALITPATSTCGISLNGAPTATCVAISATQGLPITPVTLIGASGSGGPYTFSAVGLPAGLTMNSAGQISGTPTVNGNFTYTITVTDANGHSGTVTCSITVAPPLPPLTVACAAGTGQITLAYSSALVALGGTGHYAFSISAGALAPGLTLNTANGFITGTPTASGNYSFTAKVTDTGSSAIAPVTSTCGITIADRPTTSCVLITSFQGTTITPTTLTGAGGAGGPYTFTATGLPAGLSISSTGTISGTATLSGSYTYTVYVTDKNGVTGSINCTMTVAPTAVIGGGPVGTGDTATIGFWNNKNGQYLISIANGGGTSTALANWLATSFPAMFGATSPNNLTGKKNSDVAALFTTFFKVTGTKTKAQVMAGALAVYITSTSLSGTDATMVAQRTKFHFNSSTGGTGTKTWNVGTYGTALGLTNNQSYTVLQLLNQANLKTQQGTFDMTAFNVIFNGINVAGDII